MLSALIDKLIRRTVLGSMLSRLRGLNPRLYVGAREFYNKLFSMKSRFGLARYQVRSINTFLSLVPAEKEKPFLEIGSDLEGKTLLELQHRGFKKLVGINPEFDELDLERRNQELPEGCSLYKADIRNIDMPDESFGSIFSVSVFEHLLDFEECLSEMHRLLAPGGYVYAEFGPIWSSSLGHHVHADHDLNSARHWDPEKNPIKNYSHLLLDRAEMYQALSSKLDEGFVDEIVKWIYDKPYINRLFFEDYIRAIEKSEFKVQHIEYDKEYISSEQQAMLEKKYPGNRVFNIRNVELVLVK